MYTSLIQSMKIHIRCKNYFMTKKRKQKIFKKAVAEALSLGTGGSAGTPCNLLLWWLPSYCHISNFLFQMSWVTRNQNKAYLISYHCLPPCQSGSHQWSFLSLLQLFRWWQSANAAGHGAPSAHLWTLAVCPTCGHWQVTVLELSGLIAPILGTSGCFQSTAPLSLGFTSALTGFHPTVCHAGREQTQAATSEVLLYIQGDWLHLAKTDWSETEALKMTWRNPERESSQYSKWDLSVFQRN